MSREIYAALPEHPEGLVRVEKYDEADGLATAAYQGKTYTATCKGLNVLFAGAAEIVFYPGIGARDRGTDPKTGIETLDLTKHKEIARQTALVRNGIRTLNSWMVS